MHTLPQIASTRSKPLVERDMGQYFAYLDGPRFRSWRPEVSVRLLAYNSYSIWLFTASDLKTIVGPTLVFGIANALALSSYGLETPAATTARDIGWRLPLVALWIWMNLLPFAINNQTTSGAVQEDMINKPWRSLPAGRMTIIQAKWLMLCSYPLSFTLSLFIGGFRQSMGLVFLGVWYNNLAGGDSSCLLRNTINACGYLCFTSGAMEVAAGVHLPPGARLVQWLGIIAAVILSTVHLQDMYDQTGDRVKGRKTVPLVVGDGRTRWSTAFAMIFWGFICPHYWQGRLGVLILSSILAVYIAARGLLLRTVSDDRLTFKLWNAWMTLIFMLPLLHRMGV